MKKKLACVAVVLLLANSLLAIALDNQSKLDKAAEKIANYLKEKKPEWERSETSPITGSQGLVIAKWAFDERAVSVSILEHKSQKEAEEVIRRFAPKEKDKKPRNLGDEGYMWNIRGSIAFRKGNLTIYVNAVAPDLAEQEALCDEFSRYVAEALNALR